MQSPVETYLAARRAFEAAREELSRCRGIVATVSRRLSDPKQFTFSDVTGGVSIDVEWPTVEQIRTLVNKWNDTWQNMKNAYSHVPEADRPSLQPPPER
jgi:hypothetical protein